eukprot:Lankesteria_metandrocarpae@DN7080_c0_g1_i1.p1
MVLADLGGRITSALHKLQTVSVIDEAALDACLKEIAAALLHGDVNVKFVAELRKNVRNRVILEDAKGVNKRKLIHRVVVEQLVSLLTPDKKPLVMRRGKQHVVMFVGLQGSGKTTTCAKYAHYYSMKGWKAAMVCADTYRAGAFDQLKQNATRAKIPFYGSYTESDPVKIADEGVKLFKKEKFDLIIVDTSGRHKQEAALFEEMQQVAAAVEPDDVIFVMDSHIGQACHDQAKAFGDAVSVGSVIVTKLDGHAKGGGALSAVAATDSPISFLGTGELFEDFEIFEAKGFVSRLLGMGDITGLMNTIQDVVQIDKQPQMLQRIAQGIFTIRDMREQLKNVMKIGPLGKVMSMIPGMSADMIPKGQEEGGTAQVKKFLCMMDSMTADELDCVKPFNDSRIMRVARGSGSQKWEVDLLLAQYKQFSKMIGKMGKSGLAKQGGPDLQQMMRNPNQMRQKMNQIIDPKILKQMGGTDNFMSMMKEMGKMEGQPQFKDMMKGMM